MADSVAVHICLDCVAGKRTGPIELRPHTVHFETMQMRPDQPEANRRREGLKNAAGPAYLGRASSRQAGSSSSGRQAARRMVHPRGGCTRRGVDPRHSQTDVPPR